MRTWLLVALMLPLVAPAQASDPPPAELVLTLDDAVRLALRNNRTLLSARHRREVDAFSLDVSADRYRPRATIDMSVQGSEDGETGAALSGGPSLRIPTGGQVRLDWSQRIDDDDDGGGTWALRFSQPLLKGFGPAVDTAPVELAELGESRNLLAFRDAIATVIVSVITAYRAVIRAEHAMTISRESLAGARKQLEVNRALIQAGRMASRELVQNEAEIANRRLALVERENALSAANAALVSILDIDAATTVRAAKDLPAVERRRPLDLERSVEIALASRTEYRRAELRRQEAEMKLALAEDKRRWDLALNAGVSRAQGSEHDVSARLALSVPFGDRAPKLGELRARNELRDTKIALVELRQSIRIAVRQAVNEVDVGFRRVELARKAREFAEEQVEVEQEKLAQGLTSTFQFNAVENDLVAAKTKELDATIAYLNALTGLDRTLGTTLKTWNIDEKALESVTGAGAHVLEAERNASASRVRKRTSAELHHDEHAKGGARAAPGIRRTATQTLVPSQAHSSATRRDANVVTATRPLLLSITDFEGKRSGNREAEGRGPHPTRRRAKASEGDSPAEGTPAHGHFAGIER